MKKLTSALFLLFAVLMGCKDPDPVVEPEVSPGVVVVGVTTTFTSFTPTSAKDKRSRLQEPTLALRSLRIW